MRGLWLEARELRLREDLPYPAADTGEAIVRVLRAGICDTDLQLLAGYAGFTGVPGHEFVGRVESGPSLMLGRRVVGEINAACRRCPECAAGRHPHCRNRTVLGIRGRNGAFAEYVSVPPENLHPVPTGVSTDAATFTEPLAAALRIGEQVAIGPGDRVLVAGDGKLGLLTARALSLSGCVVRTVGRHPERLGLFPDSEIVAVTPQEARGHPFDIVIDCTGSPDGFALARSAVRPGGTLVLKSTYAGELTHDVSALVVDEITVVGSRCGPFESALRMLSDGSIEPRPLIQARYPLERGLEALEHAARPGVLKVLLEMQAPAEADGSDDAAPGAPA